MGELLRTKSLRMVDVRKYDGVQDGMQAWTFLGYDIVSFDEEGKAVSVLADEETKYDVLKPTYSEVHKREVLDHSGILVGDIRAKVVENRRVEESFLGEFSYTSKEKIQERLDLQKGFYFLHYNDEIKSAKVKSLGSK